MAQESQSVNCPFFSDTPIRACGGTCKLGLYGGLPSFGVCRLCIRKGQNNQAFAYAQKNPTPPVQEPSLLKKAQNLAGAVKRTAVAAAKGEKIKVSDEEVQRRMEICQTCENFNQEKKSCRICGCIVRFKTVLATEHCPVARW